MSFSYPVMIEYLLSSPTHRYLDRPGIPPVVLDQGSESLEVVAFKGIRGDRYFGKAAHADALVTLLAIEALEAVAAELNLPMCSPLAARRNVVLRGAAVVDLMGQEFVLDCRANSGDAISFQGRREAAPCGWMNEILGPGAQPRLRGRGGLRCVPTSSGVLRLGEAVLVSPIQLDPTRADAKVRRVRR